MVKRLDQLVGKRIRVLHQMAFVTDDEVELGIWNRQSDWFMLGDVIVVWIRNYPRGVSQIGQ
jgi:hypothetical protein